MIATEFRFGRKEMAREGYLIMDSDLHMMEPDDLWARYLDEPHRTNPPRFYGGQQRQLAQNSDDKGNADTIMGMEVQGLAIPAHGKSQGATASSRDLLLSKRTRQVFETEACIARNPSNRLPIGTSWGRSASKTCQIVRSIC